MAPKKRTKDKHLPPRVYIKHGAYYLVTMNKKWIRLGATFSNAMAEWAKLTSADTRLTSMGQLFDRYILEVSPLKASSTHKFEHNAFRKLRAVFGDMAPDDVTPVHIYQYLDIRGKEARRAANLERGVLSHVFTKAIEWGIVNDNPCRNVKRLPQKKRTRYVTDAEFETLKAYASPLVRLAMQLAYLTGLRKADVLSLKLTDLLADGISITPAKTEGSSGVKLLIEWSPELRKCVEAIKQLPRDIRGMHLFSTRNGTPYSTEGFDSIWQRTVRSAHEKGIISERFRFHDLRRKAATDAERLHGREYARRLLAHSTQAMTANYISGEQRVRPVK